jgi:hypothetical protein
MTEPGVTRSLLATAGPINQSVEHMFRSIMGYRSTLEIMRQRHAADPAQLKRIEECEIKLDEAQRAVVPDSVFKRRKIFVGWNLLQQVSEEFFLLFTPEELIVEGRRLLNDIGLSPMPEPLKLPWQSEIAKYLEGIEKTPGDPICRQTLKMAMTVLNAKMNTLFWNIRSRSSSPSFIG